MYKSAKKYFDFFIKSNFDITEEKISHKLNHTYHVVENAIYICDDMKLSDEDKKLAMLIALLHDIGRFDQAKQMESFREDVMNYDHAALGIKLLFEIGEIRNFIKTDKYDEIIKKAIGNHSKFILDESDLNEKELLHCKIIRDADKLDIYRLLSEGAFFDMAKSSGFSDNTHFTSEVLEAFYNNKQLPRNKLKTTLDYFLNTIAFVYDINYNISFKILKEKRYLEPILDIGTEINDQEQDEIEKIKKHINKYVEEKLV